MNPSIRLRKAIPLCLVAVACFAVSSAPKAFGVSPPPDGGYRSKNTAEGDDALFNLAGGFHNTAIGFEALFSNTDGYYNTAIGALALATNIGSYNTATGAFALYRNTHSVGNTATGAFALYHNTTGSGNTANGDFALFNNKGGFDNTAIGAEALFRSINDHDNTAIGESALSNKERSGSGNIALGVAAGSNLHDGDNNIYIGNGGARDESNTIRIGSPGTHTATFIAGISEVTVAGGVEVVVDSNGQLGTVTSSERFKDDIKPMDKSSEAILALQPVTFRYKHEFDPDAIPQFGLVAEQVEKVNPDLVARDADRKPYTVRYEAVNAMLLNEFLKEHREVQELKKQVEALTMGLQKVSAQLEASKPAPQVVNNP
jgi:endosialidase-like protein